MLLIEHGSVIAFFAMFDTPLSQSEHQLSDVSMSTMLCDSAKGRCFSFQGTLPRKYVDHLEKLIFWGELGTPY